MRVPSLLESLLSSKQDAVPAAASLDPQHPSTSSISPLPAGLAPSSTSKTYQRLKRQCLKRRQLFVDLDFPPTNESLFLDEKSWNGANLEIEWKRPAEIVENPKLFVEGASPFDVTQGILGNCWFVSACSALTHNEALLQKVIPEGQEWAEGIDYAGIFQFCFWRFGRWVDVLIDDLLPCKDGKLLFARSKTPNEFWSALLEKAFAKLYGCYENLVGGQLADALQDVSGGVAESLKVREFLRQHQLPTNTAGNGVAIGNGQLAAASPKSAAVNRLGSMDGSKRLFYQLKHAFDREALIVAAIAAKKEDIEKSLDCGLVLGHAYAVTAIRYIELDAKVDRQTPDRGSKPLGRRQAMVRLQNPWGEKEWNGPWSDGSSEWEQVTAEQKRRLGITVDEDGEFWMPWEDFVRYFSDISVCQLLNTESVDPTLKRRMSMSNAKASRRSNATIGMPEKQHREWTFFGRWSTNGVKSGAPKDRAGGCLNFPATFCFNPQFMFDVPSERGSVEVMFALSQRDDFLRVKGQKKNKHRQPYLVIGLHLMRVERNRRHRIHQAINPVATSEFSSGRSMYLLADLSPGRYILVPSTYAPREETDFMLRIYSTLPSLNPVQLEQDLPPARASLAKCGLRVQCVTRLRILEVFFTAAAKTNADGPGAAALPEPESELFCRVASSTGQQRAKTEPQILMEPGQPVKFNESFIFFSRSASQNLFVEVLERRKPFKRRNKSLGRAQFRVLCDQNDCTLLELELKSGRKENSELAAPVAKVRVEVCSYDDPLYI